MVESRLLRRPGNFYEFTELGMAVWRVERSIRKRYMRT